MDEKVMEHSTRSLDSFNSSVNGELETFEIKEDVQTSQIIDEYGVGIDKFFNFSKVLTILRIHNSLKGIE